MGAAVPRGEFHNVSCIFCGGTEVSFFCLFDKHSGTYLDTFIKESRI